MALNVAWVIVTSWMGMFDLVNMLQRGGVSVIFCSFGTKLPVVSLETFELGNGWDVLVVFEHANADRLLPLGHWPKYVERKGNCVVCQAIINRKNLPKKGNRHESRIQCEHCLV